MNRVVIDASVALAWCFPDEASAYADSVLMALDGKEIHVPAVWALEVANALLVGERAKRLGLPEIRRFSGLVESLGVIQDSQPVSEEISNVLPLARQYTLAAYDAAYVELAIRHGAPLATLDRKLQTAARKAAVKLFPEVTT